jgi:hypothetical protein
MVPLLILVTFGLGYVSIASACFNWVRSRAFGLAGVVLSIVGLFFIGASLWVSGIYATPKPEAKSTDNTAIQRLIEDTNAKAVAAFKESNKQLADQLNAQQQQFATEMRDSENRMLSDLQSHILAIRTALTERPAPPPRSVNDGFNEKPKPQGRKNR